MAIIDLRTQLEQLRLDLAGRSRGEPRFGSLGTFLADCENLPGTSKEPGAGALAWSMYLDGVIRALSGLYVHMPFKRARHGANPIERLSALGRKLPTLTELDFQQALLTTFLELHDPHTRYLMPEPYSQAVAFLPFSVEVCYDVASAPNYAGAPEPQFMITRVAKGFGCPGFGVGAKLTHWNGVQIGTVVHSLAMQENGANIHASFAQAVDNLTFRRLDRLLPPEASTITIGFEPAPGTDSGATEAIMEWSVRFAKQRSDHLISLLYGSPAKAGWEAFEADLPFDYKILSFPHPVADEEIKVGVIRITSFDANEIRFTKLFAQLADKLAKEAPLALIIDVRGNRGGTIQCGERILQLLTPRRIEPVSFQFLNTPMVRQLAADPPADGFFDPSLKEDTGVMYSQGVQLTKVDDANSTGQRYFGRVAIITDALCYSTTDIFTAGFQDHRIGPVIGVDGSTGAGGANVQRYNSIAKDPKLQLPPLAGDIKISVRQCIRTGRFQGRILEDFGVAPDYLYHRTKEDLFGGDQGLYQFAFDNLLYGEGLRDISVDLQVNQLPPESSGGPKRLEILCQTSGVSLGEVLINQKIAFLFEADREGCRWREVVEVCKTRESIEEVELRCYDIRVKRDVSFHAEEEAKKLPEGDKRDHHLVASRKVRASRFGKAAIIPAFKQESRTPQATPKILWVVRGGGRASAVASLTIAREFAKIAPEVEIKFASYGSGERALREAGQPCLDLKLPEWPRMGEVRDGFSKVLKELKDFNPDLIVSHEEYEIAHYAAAWMSPCVLLTADLDRTRWNDRKALLQDLWHTILLSHVGSDRRDDELQEFPHSRTGTVLRPLPTWREGMQGTDIHGFAQLARQQARREARAALGLPDEEFIASVFIDPSDFTELRAPIFKRLEDSFQNLDETSLVRTVLHDDWDLGAITNFQNLPFRGKRLLWDSAARVRSKNTFNREDYARIMAASDLAITRGSPNINLELKYMGVPTISVSPVNPDLQLLVTVPDLLAPVDPGQSFFSEDDTSLFPEPPLTRFATEAALRLHDQLSSVIGTSAKEWKEMIWQLRETPDLQFSVFQERLARFEDHLHRWEHPQNLDLLDEIRNVLQDVKPMWRQRFSPGEEESACRALKERFVPRKSA